MLNMDDYTKVTLQKICCTCLSIDRKLHQLCKLDDGINNLFFLLSSDSEAYKAMFSRDATLLFICWECSAIMIRQRKFIEQVCIAQKQLSQIIDQQLLLSSAISLSKLNSFHQNTHNVHFLHVDNIENFVDCGPDINDIKCEPESNINNESANDSTDEYNTELIEDINIEVSECSIEVKPLVKKTSEFQKEILGKKGSVQRKVKNETDNAIKEDVCLNEQEIVGHVEIKKLEHRNVNVISINDTKCGSESNMINESAGDSSDEYNVELIKNIKVSEYSIEITPLRKKTRELKKDNLSKKGSVKRKFKDETDGVVEKNAFSKIKMSEHVMVECDEIKMLEEKNVNVTSINDTKCGLESNINNKSANYSSDEYNTEHIDEIKVSDRGIEIQPLVKKTRELKKDNSSKKGSVKIKVEHETDDATKEDGYSKIIMTEEEMVESVEIKKLEESYVNATSKCESCVAVFKDENELEEHNSRLHEQKTKFVKCDICLVYIKYQWLSEHRDGHYRKYQCNYCELVSYTLIDILTHLRVFHSMKDALPPGMLKKLKRKAMLTNPVLVPKKQNQVQTDGESPLGFKCNECNKYFENRYLRYRHIMRSHREGHKCPTCGKTFALKHALNIHLLIHSDAPPKQPCPICGKLLRTDCLRVHARVHSERKSVECVSCDKRFISHDSYERHLKYSSKHAVKDIRKYKCTICEKRFRTKRELSDHIDYNHMGRTQHKCPICDKPLATGASVTLHVSRAHHGVKKSREKLLCKTCGKAFTNKKCLREHELIHSGEKPLSCDECGRTFRQSACLYTHKRRVHKMATKMARVWHASGSEDQVGT